MGSRRITAVTVLLLTLILASPGVGTAAPTLSLAESVQVNADTVLLRVSLQPNGDAEWRVEYRLRLDDENATEAFESLRGDIEANQSAYETRFAERLQPTVADAEVATGRDMALENVTVTVTDTTIPQEYGVITYSFVWTNFAAVEESRMVAGDAISGLFLDEQTSLIIGWPTGYDLVDVAPDPHERRDRAVVWVGRLDFAEGEPVVEVIESTGSTTTTTSTDPPTTSPGDQAGGLPWGVFALAIIVLVVLGGGVGWFYTRHQDSDVIGEADGATDPPEELLSNQERVLRVLESHGGRIKQQQVASELGWTDAKTSQVVGDLRDAGEVKVFRLGRENVISLPDEETL